MKKIRFLKQIFAGLLLCGAANPLIAYEIKLNDTGADWCGTSENIELKCPQADYPRQDGEFGRDALAKAGKLKKIGGGHAGFDFSKLDKDGKLLRAEAKEWSCVRDNHTGLEWEVKTTSGLHDRGNRYSWYNPDASINGGDPGVRNGAKCKGSGCDTLAFVTAVNKQGLCGHQDWRVPTMMELQSIVDYGKRLPAIDTDYFPHTPVLPFSSPEPSIEFWASETWPQLPNNAWSVDFRAGLVSYRDKGLKTHQVRLVRKAQKRQTQSAESGHAGGK